MTEFEEIYRAYFNDVYLYILRLSGNEHIAEEITSETFFRAMKSLDSFRGDCDIRVWLCQIAKNRYATYMKRAKRFKHLSEEELFAIPSQEDSPAEEYARREQLAALHRILHDIPEPYKEVFMWRTFADLSFKQIGSIFGKSDNWACVTYHRARNMIREKTEEKKE